MQLSRIFAGNRKLFWLVALATLLHLPFMQEPPRSIHVWRQTLTLSMARNFVEEGMQILEPKVDRRMDTKGITGSQFLSYEWLLALLYKIFGIHENISRWFSLALYLLAIIGFYRWLQSIALNETTAFAGSFLLAFSPELFYHGINAMPDILAMACSIWGMYFFFKFRTNQQSYLALVASLLLISLAGLTKLQYLAAGIPVFVVFIQDILKKKYSGKSIFIALITGLIGVTACVSWYIYARYLINQSGLQDVGIVFHPETDLIKGLGILKQNLVSDLPELLLGYSSFILFTAGVYVFFKKNIRQHVLFKPILVWTIALIVYHLIELGQMGVHQYYMLPYFPLLFLVAALGFSYLKEKLKWVAILLLLLSPIFASIRIIPARWAKGQEGIKASFYEPKTRAALENLIGNKELIVTGPDVSGCINFYFLHKKGFCFDKPGDAFALQWNGKTFIEDAIERGAKYAYVTDNAEMKDTRWTPFIKKEIFRNEEVMVVALVDEVN